ncbi:hypothetical protein AC578_1669 [Pseudocercospora eumusae]|uniref:GED domain-containing protein n=1 Tax=Pseudocercospora eumusae TaxID=321146 RepID=A0A139GXF9_9PEZI|nr:hypothetical protein AC578_1669 [Pseudocercospora eumusae]
MSSDDDAPPLKRSSSPLFEPSADIAAGDSGAKRLKLTDDDDDNASVDLEQQDVASIPQHISISKEDSLHTRDPYPTPEYRDHINRSATHAELEAATSPLPTDLVFDKRRPRLAAYHPFIEIVEAEVPKACIGFLRLYKLRKQEGYINDTMEIVYEKIVESCIPKQRYPKTKPVVFIGVMGAGKSQLVSALLGIPDIAVTSDSERGTNIVHEFVGLKKDQETRFLVEALYYPVDKIEKRIMTLCRAVFDYFEAEKQQETDPDSVDEADIDELNDRFLDATNVLHTILCDPEDDDFATKDALGEWLKHQWANSTLVETVDKLMGLTSAYMDGRGVENEIEMVGASSVAQLKDIYEGLSRPPKSLNGRHPWPLIRSLQVHLDNDFLNQGVTVTDTPGLDDTNQTVVDATKNYIHRAGTVLIVAPNSRCAQSSDIRDHLRLANSAGKMRNTQLVLTKIDVQGGATNNVNLPAASRDAIRKTEEAIRQIQQRKETLVEEKNRIYALDNIDAKQKDKLRTIDQELEAIPGDLEQETNILYQHQVLGRNANTREDMRGKLREITRSKNAADLKTHFTCSTDYEKLQHGTPVGGVPPKFDLGGTGLPEIIELLYRVPAEERIDTLTNIVQRKLPRSFENIISITSKTSFERHHEMRNAIKSTLENQCDAVYEMLKDQLNGSFPENIGKRIDEHQDSTWPNAVQPIVKKWEALPGGTFQAYCRRHGHWKPGRNQPETHWNQEIQSVFAVELQKGFDGFVDDIKTFQQNLQVNIIDMIFMPLRETLNDKAFHSASNSAGFLKAVDDRKDDLLWALNKAFEMLQTAVHQVRSDAITDHDDDSYVGSAMSRTYDYCATLSAKDFPKKSKQQSGNRAAKVKTRNGKSVSGPHAERMKRIRALVADPGPDNIFCAVGSAVSNSCKDIIPEWLKKVEARLKQTVESIMKEFNNRYRVPEANGGEKEGAIEAELREEAHKALEYFYGRGKMMLDEAKKWEQEGQDA